MHQQPQMDLTMDSEASGAWRAWTDLDITDEFMSSVKQLDLGELLKCEPFTLLEAMSAIELMDPKMDSGMMLRRINRKILTFEQSIKVGRVKINHLELNELIGIIDDTYACFATWLEGHSLAQTVMTNLYLHEPERIEDRCLRVFSQSALKLVEFVDLLVQKIYCIEEEDFVLNANRFNLANLINDQKVLNSLEDLCQQYEKLMPERQANSANLNNSNINISSKSKSDQQHQKSLPNLSNSCNQPDHDKTKLAALIDRLRFTYNFYAGFLIIFRSLLKNYWDLESQTDSQLMKTIKLVQSSALNCDQHFEKCLNYLDKWSKTIELGIKPEILSNSQHEEEDGGSNEGDYPTIMGFEPLIKYKTLPPAYPRCSSIKSRPSTIEYLKSLIIRLREVISISNSFNQNKSFNKSLDLMEHFSKHFRPKSCVISRSLILTLYLPNRSVKMLKEELLQSMSDFCDPLIQTLKKDGAKFAALDEFLDENAQSFSQAISIYGHNTARQHEKFPELILTFKSLQYSSVLINTILNSNIICSWTTCQLARLCIKYVLSGLELELFSPHEYPYVFWYLYDILYKNEREQLELARRYIYETQLLIDDAHQKKGSKNKKQRKKNQFSTNFHDKSLLCNDAFRFLTGGTFLLTYGLRAQGKIKSPVMDFTTDEICFEHRFGIIGAPVFQSYKQTINGLDKLEKVYGEASECFSEAKELFATIEGHEDCLKVCKTNMVVARILSSNLNSFNDREIEFCFDTHPSFPTVKI